MPHRVESFLYVSRNKKCLSFSCVVCVNVRDNRVENVFGRGKLFKAELVDGNGVVYVKVWSQSVVKKSFVCLP